MRFGPKFRQTCGRPGYFLPTAEVLRRQEVREAMHPAKAIRDAVIDNVSQPHDIAILTVRVGGLVRKEGRP